MVNTTTTDPQQPPPPVLVSNALCPSCSGPCYYSPERHPHCADPRCPGTRPDPAVRRAPGR